MFRRYFAITSVVILGGLLGLFLWSTYSVVVLDRANIYAENGLLENIQAILLAMACVAFLALITFEKRSDKLILLFCSLLCLAFLLRELDVEKLDVPDVFRLIGSGAGRNTLIAAALAGIFAYAAFRIPHYAKAGVQFLKSRAGVLLMAGGLLLVVGDLFEKQSWIVYHDYFEELFEVFAYVCILLAALAA